jgi:hypothetical protein
MIGAHCVITKISNFQHIDDPDGDSRAMVDITRWFFFTKRVEIFQWKYSWYFLSGKHVPYAAKLQIEVDIKKSYQKYMTKQLKVAQDQETKMVRL